MNHKKFTMSADLSILSNDELFLGNTHVRLLKQVLLDGSIHAAAKNLKMSYQYAWHLLDKLNTLSPIPVVIRQKGGRDGGGCTISAYGQKLIRVYELRASEIEEVLSRYSAELRDCYM